MAVTMLFNSIIALARSGSGLTNRGDPAGVPGLSVLYCGDYAGEDEAWLTLSREVR